MDLDPVDLRAALHALRPAGRLRSGVVLHAAAGDDPDKLSDAADGTSDLLSARRRAGQHHPGSDVQGLRTLHFHPDHPHVNSCCFSTTDLVAAPATPRCYIWNG